MRLHLEPLSFTLSDLERSIQVTQVFNGLYLQIYLIKITTKLLLMMDRKSYMKFHLALLSLTWRRQVKVRHISEGCNLETLADTAKLIANDGG